MLDTNVAIGLRDGDPAIIAAIAALDGAILLSIITRVELEGGVYRETGESGTRRARLDAILATLPVVPFEAADADAYGKVVAATGSSRRKLLDRMIASQAIVRRAILVTRNADDFHDIPGLSLRAW
jgi:predicted nucleic acid-binding protein